MASESEEAPCGKGREGKKDEEEEQNRAAAMTSVGDDGESQVKADFVAVSTADDETRASSDVHLSFHRERIQWHRELIEKLKLDEAADALNSNISRTFNQTKDDIVGILRRFDLSSRDKSGGEENGLMDGKNQRVLKEAQDLVEKTYGLEKGPTLLLKCIDGMDGKLKSKDIVVQWDDSWEMILQKLKRAFKRDVIFEYEVDGRIVRVQDDEAFDRAMELAESSGGKLYGVIQQAMWKNPIIEDPEPDEPEPEEEPLLITCSDRMAYNPAPYKFLLGLGGFGLAACVVACLVGYLVLGGPGPYLGAISGTIPLQFFVQSFIISNSDSLPFVAAKSVVAIAGAVMGCLSLKAFIEASIMEGAIAAALCVCSTLFLLYVLSPLVFKFVQNSQTHNKRKARGRRRKQQRRLRDIPLMVAGLLRKFSSLLLYVAILGLLQYLPMYHISNVVAANKQYSAMGAMYARGDGKDNHVYCSGYTDPAVVIDDKPAVIFESMEGFGQALAVSEIMSKIARIGIACAYDRAGFGWSPPTNMSRTPSQIASELAYMLTKNNIYVTVPPRTGQSSSLILKVNVPVVLVGHSVGAFYVRAFAQLYPQYTAAMVIWDGLPSEDETLTTKFVSSAMKVLSPTKLQLCYYYLEPMGLADLFLKSVIYTPLLNGTYLDQPQPAGIGENYQRMLARMISWPWCDAVYKEYIDLYFGPSPGIAFVYAGDAAKYDIPMVVWSRYNSVYQNMLNVVDDVKYTIGGQDACLQENTNIQNPAVNHPEGTKGWQCVQFHILSYSKKPFLNPNKRTCFVKGKPELGNNNPCPDIYRSMYNGTELAPMQGTMVQAELVDTILNAWQMLNYTANFPSTPFALVFQGFSPQQLSPPGCVISIDNFRSVIKQKLIAVLGLRFEGLAQIELIEGPTACPRYISRPGSGLVLGQIIPGECPATICYDLSVCSTPWTSARNIARRKTGNVSMTPSSSEEIELQNIYAEHYMGAEGGDGVVHLDAFAEMAFFVLFRIVGFKNIVVQNAANVLLCPSTECDQLPLDPREATGVSPNTTQVRAEELNRRNAFYTQYNVTTILSSERTLSSNTWKVISNALLPSCPENTYVYGGGCRQCPANSTSPAGSVSETACVCDRNYYMNLVDSEYVCIHCPDNMQSVQASTAITDCKCNPGYTGPDGVACTPCPVNTYKAVLGDFPCTYCNASNVGCPTRRSKPLQQRRRRW
ncbi:hypothetical protein GUITHDRAFT_166216 [Guillardia theta CCMP2712]|uniref:Tyrosine-protein kinase ephrin type A/B receptor-like domain-containing protein n=1 Tax=Guillardia theta (strain CCMP2712) TaxID=905079 RepID=L1IF30_GUITC|nr:hypothetical protein GUITHDRAFT_166216 [Guillardia theta CCMP2712]EKX34460.1 hypothetical protein GUITHDRAFT_166216 [Guillardia theta CCMP2712]|eukprot:XP_005821440.1 hypothetical protein GUITHDRAFT_166216 [Guillardia theta CCMP2712]